MSILMLLILLPGTSRMLTKIFPTIFLSYTKSLSFNKIHKTTDNCKLICKIISVYSFLHLPTAFKKFKSSVGQRPGHTFPQLHQQIVLSHSKFQPEKNKRVCPLFGGWGWFFPLWTKGLISDFLNKLSSWCKGSFYSFQKG